MTFISYAQNFEDVILWRALHEVQSGRYLDIGAQHPVIDSVSLAFYNAGWRGMHVEPVPIYAASLRQARPDEQVIEAAVSDADGPIKFYELGGLSSGREDVAEHHAKQGHAPKQILVTTVRLDKLFETVGGKIHWMKIDVEGMELEVLRSWGGHSMRPWILVIESTFPNTQVPTQDLWLNEVRSRGYNEVYFDGLSRYFLHESQQRLRERFSAPANVFDKFHVTAAHFTSGMLTEQAAQSASQFELREAELNAEIVRLQDREREATVALLTEREARAAADAHSREMVSALNLAQRAEADASVRADKARAEQMAALEALAAAEREKTKLVDGFWRERQEAEFRLREHYAAVEFDLRAAASASERDLAAWKARAEQQAKAGDALAGEISRLQGQIDELQHALAVAQHAIGGALAAPRSRWQRFGERVGLTSADGARRVLHQWSSDPVRSNVAAAQAKSVGSNVSDGRQDGSVEMLTLLSLDQILALPPSEFVSAAYNLILGREPDRDGRTYYEGRLSSGRSKLEVLRQLIRSPEVRERGRHVEPVLRAIRRKELTALPLVGRLFSKDVSTLPLSAKGGFSDGAGLVAQGAFATVEQIELLSSDLSRLKSIVDGLGFAIEGLTKAQKRHEEELTRLSVAPRGTRRGRASASKPPNTERPEEMLKQ